MNTAKLERLPAQTRLDRITLLAIVPDEYDYGTLQAALTRSNWEARRARSRTEALAALKESETPVVICDCHLPGGNWRDVLEDLQGLPHPPHFILMSNQDVAIWAELLNLGGYDLLEKPVKSSEFFRVVSTAWRHWRDGLATACRCSPGAMAA